MRVFRIAALFLAIVLMVCAVIAALLIHNQGRLIALVLARIDARTGMKVVPASSRLALSSHLIVVLEKPKVLLDGKEVATLERIRAVVSYHALLFTDGLPLHALALNRPKLVLPEGSVDRGLMPGPQLGAAVAQAAADGLGKLRDLTQRLSITGATVSEPNGATPYVEHFDVLAFRKHRWSRLWLVNFDVKWMRAPLAGAQASGTLTLDPGARGPHGVLSRGKLWFWDVSVDGAGADGFESTTRLKSSLRVSLYNDGEADGTATVEVQGLTLQGKRMTSPLALGNYTVDTAYSLSAARFALGNATVQQGATTLLKVDCEIAQPYGPDSSITVHVRGLQFAITELRNRLRLVKGLPPDVLKILDRVEAGRVSVDEAAFSSKRDKLQWSAAAIGRELLVTGKLAQADIRLPGELKLPPVRRLEVSLNYARGVLSVSQGAAELDRSSVTDIAASANLSSGLDDIPYKVQLRARLDLAELYPAISRFLAAFSDKIRNRIQSVDGNVRLRLTASGELRSRSPAAPEQYEVGIEPNGVGLAIRGAPTGLKVVSGSALVRPGHVTLNRMVVVSTDDAPGSATLSGDFELARAGVRLRDLKADLHQLAAQQWLPLIVNPEELSAQGPVGGDLLINGDLRNKSGFRAIGTLTMGSGRIQFGFLRAPLVTQSATLTFDGQGLVLSVPASKLEGQPVDFKLSVADLTHPAMRIDATAARLDFEALKFVRLPWSPKTTTHVFPIEATGHIEAREANLEKLPMSDVKTDFRRSRDGDWRVYNFTAHSFGGRMDLDISGQAANDWINIKGQIEGLDVAPLFLLSGKRNQSPVQGKLWAKGDIWANSDVDFFNTTAGKVSIDLRKGTLNKFTLLSRILSLINLKSWLTAQIPDPRVIGVPFTSLTADFTGNKGNFYTDNLRLQGPIMDIVSRGSIQVDRSTLDMEIALIPFSTVSWLMSKVPLIGQNIALSSRELLAAYFHVKGPIADPRVTPKPITSVAEFVAKTLSLPINILAPGTVK
jgi:AsmA-like C-terminal region